jgi:TolB-like protein
LLVRAPQGILAGRPLKIQKASMGEESPKPAGAPTGAVFVSYASQDAGAAQRIAVALRAAGIEVWLDQSELRGGDAWDRKIRDQIRHCALFIPIISAHSQARLEGYFRREWKFAVERKRDIADELAFLLPVVIDDTAERGASVPEGFHEVQWTRLPAGATSQEFIQHVSRLLTGHQDDYKPSVEALQPSPASVTHQSPSESTSGSRSRMRLLLAAVAIASIVGYLGIDRYVLHKGTAPSVAPSAPSQADKSIAGAAPAATFAPPPHSLAVLPFVNMSGDKEQEYFSDGLTEELLNSLSRITELQVAARTSSFSFKGKDADISTIAHKLNVGSVLEGSVRRAGNTVRITAQLINTVTGFHLWSETYDRDLSNVLQLQTDIANAVANALKVTLLGDVGVKIEAGGTRNPAALDAYFRASKNYFTAATEKALAGATADYTEAIRLDPAFALAYAKRSLVFIDLAVGWSRGSAVHDYLAKARADALKAIDLARDLAEGHMALAVVSFWSLDFIRGSQECERALALAPGNAEVLRQCGIAAVTMGQTQSGLVAGRRSVVLDPLNYNSHFLLGVSLTYARRYEEAIVALRDAIALAPNDEVRSAGNGYLAFAFYMGGNLPSARAACEIADQLNKPICLAMLYDKLGQHADAESVRKEYQASWGDAGAVIYAEIYAQWGHTASALDWLETAMRNQDPWLTVVKTDPLFDPLRKEPRFQAIERELKFPD